MKGDFSRDSFDSGNHYTGVLMQQGRVQTDADWNEQGAILRQGMRDVARDVFGAHGGPDIGCGFEILTAQRIGRLTPEALAVRWSAVEPDSSRHAALATAVAAGDAVIGAGRYYVDGVLVQNAHARLLTEQLGFARCDSQPRPWTEHRSWLAVLDVWERHVTSLEAPELCDPALGGADTSSRAQIVWCVRVLTAAERSAPFTIEGLLGPPLGTGRLRARATVDCISAASGGYSGIENRLYRVEVHRGGQAGPAGATFKWSRSNGTAVFPVRAVGSGTITLGELRCGGGHELAAGNWVEFVDDAIVMRDEPGPLAQVLGVDRNVVVARLPDGGAVEDIVGDIDPTRHPLLRRWDQAGRAENGGALPIVEGDDTRAGRALGWTSLENGIEVWFSAGGEYRAGDYWTIPARVATHDVIWPRQPEVDPGDAPVAALRCAAGPRHRFAPLLLSRSCGSRKEFDLVDCRRRLRCAWLEGAVPD